MSLWLGSSCAQAQVTIPAPVAVVDAPRPLPAPGSGTSLLPPDNLDAFRVSGDAQSVLVRPVEVTGQNFKRALQIKVLKKPERDYSLRLLSTTSQPLAAGDVVVATFWMRGLETRDEGGQTLSAFVLERNSAPFNKSADVVLEAPLGTTWKKFVVPFACKEDIAAGEANIHFRLGSAQQTFEIGGLSVQNFQKTVALSAFLKPVQTYEGREPNALWRRAANERIEKLRKGDLMVRVVDAGKPVAGAKIEVRMRKHAFGFGSVVNTGRLIRAPKDEQERADQARYAQMFEQKFNRSVDEGSHKWAAWSNAKLRAEVDQTVAWMNERHIPMRGHVMVWPGWSNSPKWLKTEYDRLKADKGDEAAKTYLREQIHAHILEIGHAYRGKVFAWDVVNETYSNTDFVQILGRGALVDWFKWAREADPGAVLFINENTILPKNGTKRDFYESEIKFLLDNGAPLGGIGMQGHFGALASPDELERTLNRFGKFGLPIQITEFDVGVAGMPLELQADYTRDFYTSMFANPHVSDVLMWGFWEGQHWRPFKALWRRDWTVKPNGQAWMDLVFKTWWTNADGVSDAKGGFQTRGFLGDYEVTATANGKTAVVQTSLGKEGKVVTVVLK